MQNKTEKQKPYILLNLRAFLISFVSSNNINKDHARRAFVLNVLLLASITLSFIATCTSWIQAIQQNNLLRIETIQNTVITILFVVGYIFSRAGLSQFISYVLLLFYLLVSIDASYRWGATLPQGLLTYALIVVMSGILINSRFAFIMTTVIAAVLIYLTHIQSTTVIIPQAQQTLSARDGLVFSITLYLIATVSWLFNREGEAALQRARQSEYELEKERDSLARKVEEKTKELRQEQAEKIAQLYKFAEFGKSASGFLHDLSNSVNVVSSNLKQLADSKNNIESMHTIVSRARIGTKRLENFILATRKQVNNQDFIENFSINDEIYQVIEVLQYKAKRAHVTILFKSTKRIRTYGNPIKFHQFMCNFVSNAIDSYDGSRKKNRIVQLLLSLEKQIVHIQITDFGKGIRESHLEKIFDPFFSTKGFKKGTGIGLSISHDIISKDFNGKINVVSKLSKGTTFQVSFPQQIKI